MKVNIPSPLRSYTKKASSVEARGKSLLELVNNLDAQYPGIKFRMIDEQEGIREHIKLFVNEEEAHDLDVRLTEKDVVHIICALSGG